jgi:nucleotide-binding universal stress UspA family protein
VLVVRGEPVTGGFRRIVVGTDFSPCSQPAIERAVALAAPDAAIRVVHAWKVPTGHGQPRDDDDAPMFRQAMIELDRERGAHLLARHRSPSYRLDFTSREGEPVEVLCSTADLDDADLIVVGSHGHRGLRRFVLGSVAEATVRHADCTVLVARDAS